MTDGDRRPAVTTRQSTEPGTEAAVKVLRAAHPQTVAAIEAEARAAVPDYRAEVAAGIHSTVRNMRDFAIQNGERERAEAYDLVMQFIEQSLTLHALSETSR